MNSNFLEIFSVGSEESIGVNIKTCTIKMRNPQYTKVCQLVILFLFMLIITSIGALAISVTNFNADYYYNDNINIINNDHPGYEYSFQGYKINFQANVVDGSDLSTANVWVVADCPTGRTLIPLSHQSGTTSSVFSTNFYMPNAATMKGLCLLSLNITTASESVINSLSLYPNSNDILANMGAPYLNISTTPSINFFTSQKGIWNNATPYPATVLVQSITDREGQGVLMDFSINIGNLIGNVPGEVVTSDNFRYKTSIAGDYTNLYWNDSFYNRVSSNIDSANFQKALYIELFFDESLQSTSFSGTSMLYSFQDIDKNQPAYISSIGLDLFNSTHLFCNAVAIDPDGDAVGLTYKWYINRGTTFLYDTTIQPYLPVWMLQENDIVTCTALPYSVDLYGTADSDSYTFLGIADQDITVGYDDLGNPMLEPHMIRGSDFNVWGTTPEYSVATDGSKVVLYYNGLTSTEDYAVEVTYYRPAAATARLQRLYADSETVHDILDIPTTPTKYLYQIPRAAYQDGQMNLNFTLAAGDSVVVSEARLLRLINAIPEEAVITIISPTNASTIPYADTTVLSIRTDVNSECKYSTVQGFNYATGTLMETSNNVVFTKNVNVIAGTNTFYYKCKTQSDIINVNALKHIFNVEAIVLYDDLGNSSNEPHLIRGTDFTGWGTAPGYSVAADPSEVKLSYTVTPGESYKIDVTYYRPSIPGEERTQKLYANGYLIHSNLFLPTTPTTYTFSIPQGIYNGSQLNISLTLVSGNSVVGSEVKVYKDSNAQALIDNFESGITGWYSATRQLSSVTTTYGNSLKTNYTTGTEDFGYIYKIFSSPKDMSSYQNINMMVYLDYSFLGTPKFGLVLNDDGNLKYPGEWAQYPTPEQWNNLTFNISNIPRTSIDRLHLYVYKSKDDLPSGKPITYKIDNIYLGNYSVNQTVGDLGYHPPILDNFDEGLNWVTIGRTVSESTFSQSGKSMKISYTTGTEDYGNVYKIMPITNMSNYSRIELDLYLEYNGDGTPKFGLLIGNQTQQFYPADWAKYPAKNQWVHLTFDISNIPVAQRQNIKKVFLYAYKQQSGMSLGNDIKYYIDDLKMSNPTVSGTLLVDDFSAGLNNWFGVSRAATLQPGLNGDAITVDYTTGTEDFGRIYKVYATPLDASAFNSLELDAKVSYSGTGTPRFVVLLENTTGAIYPADSARHLIPNKWQHVRFDFSNNNLSNIKRVYLYVYKQKDGMPAGDAISYQFDNIKFSNNIGVQLIDDYEAGVLQYYSPNRNLYTTAGTSGNGMSVVYTTGPEDYGYLFKYFNAQDWTNYTYLKFDAKVLYSGAGNPKIGVIVRNNLGQVYPLNWAQYINSTWNEYTINLDGLNRNSIDRIYIYAYKAQDGLDYNMSIQYRFDNLRLQN